MLPPGGQHRTLRGAVTRRQRDHRRKPTALATDRRQGAGQLITANHTIIERNPVSGRTPIVELGAVGEDVDVSELPAGAAAPSSSRVPSLSTVRTSLRIQPRIGLIGDQRLGAPRFHNARERVEMALERHVRSGYVQDIGLASTTAPGWLGPTGHGE